MTLKLLSTTPLTNIDFEIELVHNGLYMRFGDMEPQFLSKETETWATVAPILESFSRELTQLVTGEKK